MRLFGTDEIVAALQQVVERLDRVTALLEYQTFGPPGPAGCPHANVVDCGRMGDKPGSRLRCKDCGMFLPAPEGPPG